MDIKIFENIGKSSLIFSIAISPDETRIACGGWSPNPVTIWDSSNGNLIGSLSGFNQQIQSLAFSRDSAKVAAANVWGGIYVWNTQDGELVYHKEESKSRRRRALTFSDTCKNKALPIMLSESIQRGANRALAPNGKLLATTAGGGVSINQYKSSNSIYRLDYLKYDIAKTGVCSLSWSSDSKVLAMAGDGWVGAWIPTENQFFGRLLPFSEFVHDIAILESSRQVVFAIGKSTLLALDLPSEPLLTNWETRYKRLVDDFVTEPEVKLRHDWNWDITQWGYEGVSIEAESLLWYSHRHSTMDGSSGANIQSFESFIAEGPNFQIPEDRLGEVCRAVNFLMKSKYQKV